MSAMLKDSIHALTEKIFARDPVWRILSRTLVRGSQFLCSVRREVETERASVAEPELAAALGRREVLAGPFQGVRYGDTRARCSALFPKLLGTYEAELAPFFEEVLRSGRLIIVDVGAADGYYAVGFAAKLPATRIIAYEQSPRAQAELRKLAGLNQVEARIEVRGHCQREDLLSLPREPGLLIVDCEGAEQDLLTAAVVKHLAAWDFVIETHDGFRPGVTAQLTEVFQQTHTTESVDAVHDFDRPTVFPALEKSRLSVWDKMLLLSEGRMHATVRWLICRPRQR